MPGPLADLDVIANEARELGEQMRSIQARLTAVEKVNGQLENAALTMSRALEEISRHWDAVYEAMRREVAAVEKVEATQIDSGDARG
jgi:methyl-accepting chemotaxis protein